MVDILGHQSHEFMGGMHLPEQDIWISLYTYTFIFSSFPLKKTLSKQTSLLNYKEFKTISEGELSTSGFQSINEYSRITNSSFTQLLFTYIS